MSYPYRSSQRYQYRTLDPTRNRGPKSGHMHPAYHSPYAPQPSIVPDVIRENVSEKVDIIHLLQTYGLFDIIEEILLSLSVLDLGRFQQVSTSWHSLLADNEDARFWRLSLRRIQASRQTTLSSPDSSSPGLAMKTLSQTASEAKERGSPGGNSPSCQRQVKDLVLLERNWRIGLALENRIEFDSFVLCLLLLDPGPGASQLLVGLNNGSVGEWVLGPHSSLAIRSKVFHTKGVKCLSLSRDGKYLFSGSYDGSLRIWESSSWVLLSTLSHHSDAVWDMSTFDQRLVSCGTNGKVCIVSLENETFPILHVIPMESDVVVSSVDINEQFIVAGRDDAQIGVWSAQDIRPLHILLGHEQGVTCVRVQDDLVASGSYDGRVRLWNATHGICLAVLKGHKDLVRALDLSAGRVVSGDFGGFLKIWDLVSIMPETTRHMKSVVKSHDEGDTSPYQPLVVLAHRSLYTHRGHVTTVKLSDQAIWSGSREKAVAFHSFATISQETAPNPN